jgi:hypothetical protein
LYLVHRGQGIAGLLNVTGECEEMHFYVPSTMNGLHGQVSSALAAHMERLACYGLVIGGLQYGTVNPIPSRLRVTRVYVPQVLADIWLPWVTRGLFIGQRRLLLDTQSMPCPG